MSRRSRLLGQQQEPDLCELLASSRCQVGKVKIGVSEGGVESVHAPSHATVVEVAGNRDHAGHPDPEFEALEIVKTRAAFGDLSCGHGTFWPVFTDCGFGGDIR